MKEGWMKEGRKGGLRKERRKEGWMDEGRKEGKVKERRKEGSK